ncbi:hypothetical protein HT031_004051 [Scenedesmus sp. PABB004]|nr:hypothetical protein HT031_004051 [Scenedesmus sp. PABB004]
MQPACARVAAALVWRHRRRCSAPTRPPQAAAAAPAMAAAASPALGCTRGLRAAPRGAAAAAPLRARRAALRVCATSRFEATNPFMPELRATAAYVATRGKGILASDESNATTGKRLEATSIENTAENRRLWRELMYTAPGLGQYISGCIMFEEFLFSSTAAGVPFVEVLRGQGIVPGIKADRACRRAPRARGARATRAARAPARGGGARARARPAARAAPRRATPPPPAAQVLPGTDGETATQGLDNLGGACREWYKQGARFAKWRAVLRIAGPGKGPSTTAIAENAHGLARYAQICQPAPRRRPAVNARTRGRAQENGLVPIVEPEVTLGPGDYGIEETAYWSERVNSHVFRMLNEYDVALDAILLKPNMCLPGLDAPRATPQQVAEFTTRTMLRSIPAAVPGIHFLSGGMSEEESTINLQALNEACPSAPWSLTFSYGRALQATCLKTWAGKPENWDAAQAVLLSLAKVNSEAQLGRYAGPHPCPGGARQVQELRTGGAGKAGQDGGGDAAEAPPLALATAAGEELFQAAARVVFDHDLPHELELLTAGGGGAGGGGAAAALKLSAGLTPELLQERQAWKRSSAAALLFKQLLPPDADAGARQGGVRPRGVLRCATPHAARADRRAPPARPPPAGAALREALAGPLSGAASAPAGGRYTLLSCFRELPSVSTAPPPMAISVARGAAEAAAAPAPGRRAQRCAAGDAAAVGAATLADVPPEVMSLLLGRLSAADLARLACCCRGLRATSWEAVPGLRLTLYPHQRNALSWMLHREVRGGQAMPHPFIVRRVTGSGVPFTLNQVTGELSVEPPPAVRDVCGGFFCDEPGLGKTVTALSLILKTQGLTPHPPPGAAPRWLAAPDGRRVGFYEPPAAPGGGGGGALRRSASGSGSGSLGVALLGGNVRQSIYALTPSLRGGASRRRLKAEAAAAEAAAEAAAAAAAAAEAAEATAVEGGAARSSLRQLRLQRQLETSNGRPTRRASSSGGGGAERSGSSDGGPQQRALRSGARAASSEAAEPPSRRSSPGERRPSADGGGGPRASVAGAADDAGADAEAQPAKRQRRDAAATDGAAPGCGSDGGSGGSEGDGGGAGEGGSEAAGVEPVWVMCDHCSKWRSLPHGHEVSAEPDDPWFCCLHPDPSVASCLVAEEPHDHSAASAGAGGPPAGGRYDSMPGYIGAEAAAPRRGAARGEPDAANVAHFAAVMASLPGFTGLQAVLRWLAAQDPAALAGRGVTVPRELVRAAPDYGRVLSLLYLERVPPPRGSSRAGWAPRGRGGGRDGGRGGRGRGGRGRGGARSAPPSSGEEWAGESDGERPPRQRGRGAARARRRGQGRGGGRARSASPSSSSWSGEEWGEGSDAEEYVPRRRGSSRGRGNRARGASSRSSGGAGGAGSEEEQQQPAEEAEQQPAAGAASGSRGASPEADAGDSAGGGGGGGGGGVGAGGAPRGGGRGGARGRRRNSAAAPYSAAVHVWAQPASCAELTFDVAALRQALESGAGTCPRMYLSPATLVIVPVTLIPHWQQQIRQHLAPRRLRVLVLGSASADTAGAGGRGAPGRGSASTASAGGGAAERACPPAHELAWGYDVVITTFQRLSTDWGLRGDPRMAERLVLLKVHWLRVVIDEGHALGASLGLTNRLAMAVQLTAARRWVMTGTPTPATAAGSGAAHLQPLLAFLHHEPFGASRSAWEGAVAKPLEAAAAAAAAVAGGEGGAGGAGGRAPGVAGGAGVLVAEWGRGAARMPRAARRAPPAAPALAARRAARDTPCATRRALRQVSLLDFAPAHAASYNALVEVIRRNLLLADWCDDAHNESLLNVRQGRWAKEMLLNVRLACCVAGATSLVPKDEDVLETLQLLAGRLELPPPATEQHAVPAAPAVAAEAAEGAAEEDAPAAAAAAAELAEPAQEPEAGGEDAGGNGGEDAGSGERAAPAAPSSGVVLRQRWFFTGPGHPLHRVEEGLRHGCDCEVCGAATRLPMVTPCAHLLCTDCAAPSRTSCPVCGGRYRMQPTDDPARFKTNPLPKWEVPLELIEWQPVFHQRGATGLSGGQWSANWRVTRSTKVLHLLRRLVEVGIYDPREAAGQPASDQTAAAAGGQPAAAAAAGQPVKAIVFSQFWMHTQLVAAELSARGVRHVLLKRDMPPRDKQAAVTAFRAVRAPAALVMDESGALGLDLSFVRHIFLMEPLADAALEQQVVSRAHRMGATAPVHVEVLAMRHTAEEHLVSLRHQAAAGRLSISAADAAASHAAAAVAGAAEGDAAPAAAPAPAPAPEAPPSGESGDALGGATAGAAAVSVSNISDFVAVGGGGNQMESRGLRNLVLLALHKVPVAALPPDEAPEQQGEACRAAAGLGEDGAWAAGGGGARRRGDRGLLDGGAAAAAAAAAAAGGAPLQGGLWADYALGGGAARRPGGAEPDAGPGSGDDGAAAPERADEGGAPAQAAARRRRVAFADDDADQAPPAAAAAEAPPDGGGGRPPAARRTRSCWRSTSCQRGGGMRRRRGGAPRPAAVSVLLLLAAAGAAAAALPPAPANCTPAIRAAIDWGAGTNSLGVRAAAAAAVGGRAAALRRPRGAPPRTAAHAAPPQIEGALREGGRGASVWDSYARATADGATPDVAADFYHRFRSDVALMQTLGLRHLRLSLSWPRLLPRGAAGSPVNPAGVKFYTDLLDALHAAGIAPMVVLYHWDMPQPLQDAYGGFTSPRIIDDFAYYADTAFRLFGHRVKRWLTFVEPFVICNMQYGNGQLAPGVDYGDAGRYACGHNLLRAHAAAAGAYVARHRAAQRGGLSFSTLVTWPEPASGSDADARAAQNKLDAEVGWWLDPVFTGDYPASLRAAKGALLPRFTPAERAALAGSLDFIAFNAFTAKWVAAKPGSAAGWRESSTGPDGQPIGAPTGVPWMSVVPWSQERAARYLSDRYAAGGRPPALLVSSSGTQVPGEAALPLRDALSDGFRLSYYARYLDSLCGAVASGGVRLIGCRAFTLAVKVGLFTLLRAADEGADEDGAAPGLTAAEIAARLGLRTAPGFRGVVDWLDVLTALDTLRRSGEGAGARYANSPEAHAYLADQSADYMGGHAVLYHDRTFPQLLWLEHSLRTGVQPQAASAVVASVVETFAGEAETAPGGASGGDPAAFALGMTGCNKAAYEQLAARFDFSRYASFGDFGGSAGVLACAVAAAQPHLECATHDLPAVRPAAEAYVARQGLRGRVRVVDHDFFSAAPFPPYDVVAMGMILHDWGQDKKRALIAKAFAALPAGGAFIALEVLIDDARRDNVWGLQMSVDMLLEFQAEGGFDYTFEEFTGWALEAGFSRTELVRLAGPNSAATAKLVCKAARECLRGATVISARCPELPLAAVQEAWQEVKDVLWQQVLLADARAARGDVAALTWLRGAGCDMSRVGFEAARTGQLAVLEWARGEGLELGSVCHGAAVGGQLAVLRWARAQTPPLPWGNNMCLLAAQRGDLEMLRWARAQADPLPWDVWAPECAAGRGQLEALRWLRANGCPWRRGKCEREAAKHGHEAVVAWIRAQPE